MNISTYFKPFLEYCSQIRGYSNQTIRSYEIALNLLEKHHEIEYKKDITIIDIMPLRLYLANHSKKAISARLSAIRTFVKYLNKHKNKNIKLKGSQSIKVPKTLPKPLREEDILKVINSNNTQFTLIIKMLYALGLRVSELSQIKLTDISSEWIRVYGKGNKTREVPIIDTLKRDIINYIELFNPKEYLFEKDEIRLKDYQIRYIIQKEFAKIGIKATPHQLRHSFASHLLNKGARVSDVSELLGHKSMATTQIYTKLTNSTKLKNYLKAHPLAKFI
jgi:integrase/recombinase XerC